MTVFEKPDYLLDPVATVTYTYDKAGNRLTETRDGATTTNTCSPISIPGGQPRESASLPLRPIRAPHEVLSEVSTVNERVAFQVVQAELLQTGEISAKGRAIVDIKVGDVLSPNRSGDSGEVQSRWRVRQIWTYRREVDTLYAVMTGELILTGADFTQMQGVEDLYKRPENQEDGSLAPRRGANEPSS